ncbi:MAG: SusC/RagA family TonB-linked outer membrane protein, partial [Hymenobacter sp.]|nr:SusC/RagA family TonB-linked outer membrane protein [Hymenobacter sp.]
NRNMLLGQAYPATLGATAPDENIGHLKVWGWEAALNWQDKKGSVGYRIGGSVTENQNKLLRYGGANLLQPGFVAAVEGYPLNSYFGLEYAGRAQTNEQLTAYRPLASGNNVGMPITTATLPGVRLGDNMFVDRNGDGKLTSPDDLKYLGRNDPRYSYAINLGADWKGFDFTAILQGVGERTIFRQGAWRVPYESIFRGQTNTWYGNTWTPDHTDAYYPNLAANQNGVNYNTYNYQASDWSVENGAYVRLKNAVLGYSLPTGLTKRLGAERIRVYYAGSDLWEKSNIRDGWDPEVTREADRFGRYPFFRLHTFGVNFTF